MSPRHKVQITGGFVLLAAWFTLVNGWAMLAIVLSAAAVHEAGHWLVLRALGAQIAGFRVSVLGAVLETDGAVRLSYAGELAAVAAGPAANLLAALALAAAGRSDAAIGAQLVLGCFNLLPIRPLDGGRALELLVSWSAGPAAGEWAARCVGAAAAAALASFLTWVMWRGGGNLWLLPALAASVYWGLLPCLPGPRP